MVFVVVDGDVVILGVEVGVYCGCWVWLEVREEGG